MYVRAVQLVIGAGSGQDLKDRIESDLLPVYRGAAGFRAYYVVRAAADTFVTIRAFENEQALEAANDAASDASEQISVDFDISFADAGEGDVVLFAQI